ncbi:MAG TPA: hypothetical protein VF807_05990 [Ktedonobacterales bacterium]
MDQLAPRWSAPLAKLGSLLVTALTRYATPSTKGNIIAVSLAVAMLICVGGACSDPFGGAASAGSASSSPTATHAIAAALRQPTAPPAVMATPTAIPSAASASIEVAVTITCASGTDYSYAKVCARTTPGATVSISVTSCSGKALKHPLADQVAPASGDVSWSWTPDAVCHSEISVMVHAQKGDTSASASMTFMLKVL